MAVPGDTLNELDWIKLREDMDAVGYVPETFGEKTKRKFGENPLIPIGCLLTASALIYGLWSFKQGNRQMSQYMMRARVIAQGFTIFAFVAGVGFTAAKK